MPLLKLSNNQYIATETVVEWKIAYETCGLITKERRLYGYTAPDEGYSICLADPTEIDAVLRWLDANSADIMTIAAAVEPSPVDDETLWTADDNGFNPHADNGGLWNSLDVRVIDEASEYHNRIGTVKRFYYDGDERLLVLSHIDVSFGKDAPVKFKPGQVIDIPF